MNIHGGYYGLVVVTPHPQTFHSHDNLKNPYRIASIFYMQIDVGERIAGKQDGARSDYLWATPNSQKCQKNILWPIYEKLVVIFNSRLAVRHV